MLNSSVADHDPGYQNFLLIFQIRFIQLHQIHYGGTTILKSNRTESDRINLILSRRAASH